MPQNLETLIANMEPLSEAIEEGDRETIAEHLRIAASSLRGIANSETYFELLYGTDRQRDAVVEGEISRLSTQLEGLGWHDPDLRDELLELVTPTIEQMSADQIRANLVAFARRLDDLANEVIYDHTPTWRQRVHDVWPSLRRVAVALGAVTVVTEQVADPRGTTGVLLVIGGALVVAALDEAIRSAERRASHIERGEEPPEEPPATGRPGDGGDPAGRGPNRLRTP